MSATILGMIPCIFSSPSTPYKRAKNDCITRTLARNGGRGGNFIREFMVHTANGLGEVTSFENQWSTQQMGRGRGNFIKESKVNKANWGEGR